MTKIYNYFILFALVLTSLTACSDWLDLQPQDTTDEEQLFETGDGYRNALNGIYRKMSLSGMYGKTLTWGELDAMAQYYRTSTGTNEEYFAEYDYLDDGPKSIIQGVWSTAYNSIANCNNLIQRLQNASPSIFEEGEDEKNLIYGEALALRAFLHFDILRLFAPSMAVDEGKKYVPYVDAYPITFQEYITNTDFLKRVIGDLKEAKDLVSSFDLSRVQCLKTAARFTTDFQGVDESIRPDDLFFAYRGYRMNYYAICGMLARVYTYAGMYKEAFDETEIVVNAVSDEYGSHIFNFTSPTDGNTKLYDELLFSLSSQDLVDDYKSYTTTYSLPLTCWSLSDWFTGEPEPSSSNQNIKPNDARALLLAESGYYWICTKYLETDGTKYQYAKDMIPMIRLGEMYLIRAEYYHRLGLKEKALGELATLRRGHGATLQNVDTEGEDWFDTAIINEARREFIQEGQLFFYYKRLNISVDYGFKTESFTWPYPDNETL